MGAGLAVPGLGSAVPTKAAAGAAVTHVGDGVGERGDGLGTPKLRVDREAGSKFLFQLADAFFDAAVVSGVICGAVERDDAFGCNELIDGPVIEQAAIVALEQQRQAVFAEEFAQMIADLLAAGIGSDQGLEAVPRGEVFGDDNIEFAPGTVPSVFGGVDSPGKVGLFPFHMLDCTAAMPVGLSALLADHAAQFTPGDGAVVTPVKFARTAAALGAVDVLPDLPAQLFQWQRAALFRSWCADEAGAAACPPPPSQQARVWKARTPAELPRADPGALLEPSCHFEQFA